MYSFLISLLTLILGYFIYGKYVEKLIKPKKYARTASINNKDGVDYMPMSKYKIFMIQYLNIAGLGPIFGAIMGAKFGTSSYLWIVFGSIFAGAVHDFVSGVISLRNNGESLPESISRYLGRGTGNFVRIFTCILLIFVTAVFVSGPAAVMSNLTSGINPFFNIYFWIALIFIYYVFATILPINKIIGHVYPIFAFALMFMACGILICLITSKGWDLPEFTDGLLSHQTKVSLFPMMFISIACGAISGFHASQSPIMARCMYNEKLARPIFFGSMILEGVEALIWAAAATYYFQHNGYQEPNAAIIIDAITKSWLGPVGAVLALLGVVCAPVSSGDTALRSARLIIADMFKFDQKQILSRLKVSIPIILITLMVLIYSIKDAAGFNTIWRYFAGSNQILAVFTLWMTTVYLAKLKTNYFVSLIPALFMTTVVLSYLITAPETLALPMIYAYIASAIALIVSVVIFYRWRSKNC